MVYETVDILRVAAKYYKELFGWENRGTFSLNNQFWEPRNRVSPMENIALTSPFSKKEIKEAVFDSYVEGTPGPDRLSFLFTKNYGVSLKEI
jgi:hypothetical protein